LLVDSRRAREIVDSLGVIEVLHNGDSVWIEALNGNEAKVSYIEDDRIIDVSVSQLVEGEIIE